MIEDQPAPLDSSDTTGKIASWETVQAKIDSEGLDPIAAAEVITGWREAAHAQLDSSSGDATSKWTAAGELDAKIAEGMTAQHDRVLSMWTQSSFKDQDELTRYHEAGKAAAFDPERMPAEFRDRAKDNLKLANHPAFQLPSANRDYTGEIMAPNGETRLARYRSQEVKDGTEVILDVTPQDKPLLASDRANALEAEASGLDKGFAREMNTLNEPYQGTAIGPRQELMRADAAAIRAKGDKPLSLKVATPTDDDVKAEAARLEAEAAKLDAYVSEVASYDSVTGIDTSPSEAKARALRDQAKSMVGSEGKRQLTDQRIAEAVKAPQFQAELGKLGLGEEFVAGLYGAAFHSAATVQKMKGAEGDYLGKALRATGQVLAAPGEAIAGKPIESLDLGQGEKDVHAAYPGMTYTDPNWAERAAAGGARMAGDMGPYLAGPGMLNGLVRKAIAPLSRTAARGATEEAAAALAGTKVKEGLGAGAVALGVGATGGDYMATDARIKDATDTAASLESQADALAAKGDEAGAKAKRDLAGDKRAEVVRIKEGQYAQAIATGVLMTVGGHIIPRGAWESQFLLGVTKGGVVMAGIVGAQEQFVNKITDPEAHTSWKSLGDAALMGGMMALPNAAMSAFSKMAKNQAERTRAQFDQNEADRASYHTEAELLGASDPQTMEIGDRIFDGRGQSIASNGTMELEAGVTNLQTAHVAVSDHLARTERIAGETTLEGVDAMERADILPPDATKEQKQLRDLRKIAVEKWRLSRETAQGETPEQKAKAQQKLDADNANLQQKEDALRQKIEGPTRELLDGTIPPPPSEAWLAAKLASEQAPRDPAIIPDSVMGNERAPTPTQSNTEAFKPSDPSVVAPEATSEPGKPVQATVSDAIAGTKPRFAPETPNGDNDILNYISETGIKRGGTNGKDYTGNIPQHWAKYLFGRNGGGETFDNMAKAAFESGQFGMKDGSDQSFADAIAAAIEGRVKGGKQKAMSNKIQRTAEQQNSMFENDRSTGNIPVDASKLVDGDQILLEGEIMTVTGKREANPEDMGDNGSVELTGGHRYGKRTMQLNEGATLMMVDGFKREVPFGNEIPMTGDAPRLQGTSKLAQRVLADELGHDRPPEPEPMNLAPLDAQAIETLKADKYAGARIIDEILQNPEAQVLTALDNALVNQHEIQARLTMEEQARIASDANTSPADRDAALKKYAEADKQIQDFALALRQNSNAWGKAGNAMQRLHKLENTVDTYEVALVKEAESKGRGLTEDEKLAVKWENELDHAAKAKMDAEEAAAIEHATVRDVLDEVKAELALNDPKTPPKTWTPTRKTRDALKVKADAARAKLRELGAFGSANMGIDPSHIPLYVDIFKSMIAEAAGKVKDVAQHTAIATAAFAKEFPKMAEDTRKQIFGKATSKRAKINDSLAEFADSQKAKGAKPRATAADVVAKAKETIAKNASPDADLQQAIMEQTIKRLFSAHIEAGMRDVPKTIAAVAESLRDVYPELTDSAIRSAIVDYGRKRAESKDPLAGVKGDMRSQVRDLEHLDRLEGGKRLLGTNAKPALRTAEAIALTSKLNAAKAAAGYRAQGPGDIKGILDTILKATLNRTAALRRQLLGKDTIRAKGLHVELTDDIKAAKQEERDVRAMLNEDPTKQHALAQKFLQERADAARVRRDNLRAGAADFAKYTRDRLNKKTGREVRDAQMEAMGTPELKAKLKAMEAERDAAEVDFKDAQRLHRETVAASPEGKQAAIQAKIKALNDSLAETTKQLVSSAEIERNRTGKNVAPDYIANHPEVKALEAKLKAAREELVKQRYGDGREALEKTRDARLKTLQDEQARDFEKVKAGAKRTPVETQAAKDRLVEIKAIEAEKKLVLAPAKEIARQKAKMKVLEAREKALLKAKEEGRKIGFERKGKTEKAFNDEIEANRNYMDVLDDAIDALEAADGSKDNVRFRDSLERRIKAMEAKEASGFEKKAKKPELILDQESQDARIRFQDRQAAYEKRKYLAYQARMTKFERALRLAGQIANLPRNIWSSNDFSGYRQIMPTLWSSLTRAVTSPRQANRIVGHSTVDMFRSWRTEVGARKVHDRTMQRENHKNGYDKWVKYSDIEVNDFSPKEEGAHSLMDEWSMLPLKAGEKMTKAEMALLPGKLAAREIRMSNRAFIALANSTRASLFDVLIESNVMPGEVPTPEFLQGIGNLVNVMTGKGEVNSEVAKLLSKAMWAPSLLASRIQLYSGQPFRRGNAQSNKVARKEYARMAIGRGAVQLLSGSLAAKLAIYTVASMFSGKKKEGDDAPKMDLANPDFQKVVIGDTHYDILGGFGPIDALVGKTFSSDASQADKVKVWGQFAVSKLRPELSTGIKALEAYARHNRLDKEGKPGPWKDSHGSELTYMDVVKLGIPLPMHDVREDLINKGWDKFLVDKLIEQLGFGVMDYNPNAKYDAEFAARAAKAYNAGKPKPDYKPPHPEFVAKEKHQR